jgi:diaminopimelate decarboxylase
MTTALAKLVHQEGFYMDVVSGGELYTALNADFPSDQIIFHGNNKSPEELEFALKRHVGRIVVDNLDELKLLSQMCNAFNRKAGILFRITPGVNSATHAYISTGKKDSKFGLPLDEDILFPAIQFAIEDPMLDFYGFHFHVGSQLFDNTAHVKAAEVTLELMRVVRERFNYTVPEMNCGGGFGIKYTKDDEPKDVTYFTDAVMAVIEQFCETHQFPRPRIFIEPGRYLIGEAGVTLYTIGSVKEIPNIKTYVAVDGGMSDNIRTALYQAKYEATPIDQPFSETSQEVTLCGKCCETGDILIEHLPLPEVHVGEVIAVFATGAYNYSMASHYNKHRIPAMVLVNGDAAYEIIEREQYSDLTRFDRIPDHLK